MTIAFKVMEQMISLFLILFIAYFLTKKGKLDAHIAKGFSYFLTNVCLPCMILHSVQMPFSPDLLGRYWSSFFGMMIIIAVGVLIGAIACLILRVSRRDAGCWISMTAFSNSFFMGWPIMQGLYGEEARLSNVAFVFIFNILCFSLGIYLMCMGKPGEKYTGRMFLRNLANPTIISGLVGFVMFISSIRFPAPVDYALELVGGMVTPLSMLIIGFSLGNSKLRELVSDRRVYILCALRLVAVPLVLLFILRLFFQDPLLLGVMMVAGAMPCSSIVSVLSEQYDNNPQLSSRTVFVSTLLSIVTAPVMIGLLAFF